MAADIPLWPAKLSREQARAAKARRLAFNLALKAGAKAAGWRYANGGMFRRHGDWFVSGHAFPLWGRGVLVSQYAKPMDLDPLFWNIVGLPDNQRLPLSFRANGAWVLRPPAQEEAIALEQADPEQLATAAIAWSTDRLTRVNEMSVESMLADLEGLGPIRSSLAALEICLRLLREDTGAALALCRDREPFDSGGFRTGDETFFDQARAWIVAKRREQIAAV